ncbi:MAG TPA: peptidylprolyl isomerase [Polyangiaceae bacterium]|jgi:FKBP-type peptidyl-prolyl cis-trans isomerase SlyD
MQIEARKVITIDYTLTDDSGEVLDSSEDDGPLSYLHGFGNIVPGLEAALEGKNPGDTLQVTVAPVDGYGERDEKLVQAIPRNRFPKGDIEVGMRFSADSAAGPRMLTVVAVDQKEVTVDGNHPLAGQTLSFDVTVREVREATEEEIEHGHVHDPDDHHHHH